METEKIYYKVLNAKMNHYGFQYQLGLNVDVKEFKPERSCKEGGLYYTTEECLHNFFCYECFIAEINIPSDAKVYHEPNTEKWKTNKLIILNIIPKEQHFLYKKYILHILMKNDMLKERIKQYRPDLIIEIKIDNYLEAVKQNGLNLEYVKEQTEQICIEAVKQNGNALKYVKEQTEQICIEAVKQNGLVLQFVKNQTEQICIEAVKQYGYALQFVKEQTPEICLKAVIQNGAVLEYVKEQTEQICLYAIKEQNGYALRYVKEQTEKLCLEAIKENGCVLEYVDERYFEKCLNIVFNK